MHSKEPGSSFSDTIEDLERPRGILSKRDRQFLLDKSYRSELADQSRRNVRARLRERLRHAILDFYLLDEYLEERDQERVFSNIDVALREGLHAVMAVLFQAANESEETFASWLEGGLTHIELEERSRLIIDEPSVEIDITLGQSVDPEITDSKIEAGRIEELSPAELRFMLWRVGRFFGNRDAENPYSRVLGEYVHRFEEETYLGEAMEMRESQSDEE